MKSYKLYIFDFDDTLLLTHQDILRFHYPQLADRLKVRYLGEDIAKKNWGGKLSDSLGATFQGNATTEQMLSALHEIYKERPITPADGALRILSILKKHRKFICIATSGNRSLVEMGIRNSLKMKPKDFDYIYSTTEHQIEKPSPIIISSIKSEYERMNKEAIRDEDIVYIGDSLHDYLTAKYYGVDFVAVTTGVHSKEDFLEANLSKNFIFENIKKAIVPKESHGVVALIQNANGEYLLLQEARINNPYFGAWSGPHGTCVPDDILEEETVARETYEECGLRVVPIHAVYERAADTKVRTVTFWEATPMDDSNNAFLADRKEISGIQWASLELIRSGSLELYSGTRDYFFHHLHQAK